MLSDKTAEKKEIDPDALMREYKQTGSLEARNKLVMHYIYIAQGMAVKMSSTYHKYATTEEMVNQCVIALINSLELGRPPTRLEMADRLQITPEKYDRCVWEMSGENIYSLETLLTTPGHSQNALTVEGVFDPEYEMDEQELRAQLIQAIDTLS